jgi:hypothetical protein
MLGLLGVFVLVQIDDGAIATLAREIDTYCAPDATVTAGDQGNLALRLARAAVCAAGHRRPRLHLVLTTELTLVPRWRRVILGHDTSLALPR